MPIRLSCFEGLAGAAVNAAVVIDHSKYLTAISELDTGAATVLCEAGVINVEELEVVTHDGSRFSCRTQIEHAGTGRTALHIAQVIQLAGKYK